MCLHRFYHNVQRIEKININNNFVTTLFFLKTCSVCAQANGINMIQYLWAAAPAFNQWANPPSDIGHHLCIHLWSTSELGSLD